MFKAFVRHPNQHRAMFAVPASEWRDDRTAAMTDARSYALLTWPTNRDARRDFLERVRIIETRH